MEHMVIIGGGQAAAWASHTLRKEGFTGKVSVISDELDVFYERPPLSKQVLLGEMGHESLQLFPQETIDEWDIHFHTQTRAIGISPEHKSVQLDNDDVIHYDKLLIATGSKARFPCEEWAHIPNVFSLRTTLDSEALQAKLPKIKEMVIVGGGWIGLEIAASMRKKNIHVTVLELGERLCARSVSSEVSAFLQTLHREEDVDLLLTCGRVQLSQGEDGKVKIEKNDAFWKEVDAVLIGAGAHINKELAIESGLETLDGIVVNEFCQTSNPDIYAAGDVAIHPSLGFCIQSWANAQNQGVIAAKSMLGMAEPYEDIPWLWSDQYDCNIQILGSPIGIEDTTVVVRKTHHRQISFFYLNKKHQLQYLVAVNDAKVIKMAKRWMKANMVLNPDALTDTSFNLMSLKA